MKKLWLFFIFFIFGCTTVWRAPDDFIYVPINAGRYTIATFQRISDNSSPLHIYIEGDGHSFDAYGAPTADPTPRSTFMRDLATHDSSPNVVYMGRPCQYIRTSACSRTDWTTGRFSADIIGSMASVIKQIAGKTPVVLIGYSGGAMVSGLIIQKYPEISVQKWVTIAGVLNHADWTNYFNDAPLLYSLNMNELPNINQSHYIARDDNVVPNELSQKWCGTQDLIIIDGATHGEFPNLKLF